MNILHVCFLMVFNPVMSNADRHGLIAKAVRDSGGATVQELAELTNASEMTIRRDLGTLAAQEFSNASEVGAQPAAQG